MIDKEIDALFIGKGNVLTSQSIALVKYNIIENSNFSLEQLMKDRAAGR